VQYEERAPHPRLRPFVEAYWILTGSPESPALDPILPDGRSEIIIHRGAPFLRVRPGDAPQRQSSLLFGGQLRTPTFLVADGSADILGIRFRPCGASMFVRAPQTEFVDEVLDAGDAVAPWLTETLQRAQDAPTIDGAIAIIEDALLARAAEPPRGFAVASAAVDRLLASHGQATIEQVAADTGLTRRHIERVFLRHVGVTPKFFARVQRFQAAVDAVARDPWIDVALEHGYADQPHLIREFRELGGASPQKLMANLGELTNFFTEAYRKRLQK